MEDTARVGDRMVAYVHAGGVLGFARYSGCFHIVELDPLDPALKVSIFWLYMNVSLCLLVVCRLLLFGSFVLFR